MNLVRNNGRPGSGLPQFALDDQYRYSVQSREHLEVLGNNVSTLGTITNAMRVATEDSREQINELVKSSHNIERLTKCLIWLTVALGVLTMAFVLGVGNKFRLEYFSERPPPTAPQTPALPGR